MFSFKKVLPNLFDNNYQGAQISLYFFMLFTALMTWRSIVHMFFVSYGLHDIANYIHFEGNPDPSAVIHLFFSLWGMAQLIFCIVCWLCILRLRSCIPALYILWLLEWLTRIFYYPQVFEGIDANSYKTGITPGAEFAPYLGVALVIFFLLSIRTTNSE